jgi:hypothetical protein
MPYLNPNRHPSGQAMDGAKPQPKQPVKMPAPVKIPVPSQTKG